MTENLWISDFPLEWLSNFPLAIVQNVSGEWNSLSSLAPFLPHSIPKQTQGKQNAPSKYLEWTSQGYFTSHSCRNFRCFPQVPFDVGNSNSRSGFQTLSLNRNFSASVKKAMTLYTVQISNSEQTGSLESSEAMTCHSGWVVHDQCTESQQPIRREFDWCTIMLSQWKRVLTSAQGKIENLH